MCVKEEELYNNKSLSGCIVFLMLTGQAIKEEELNNIKGC
jgi:hypothetical protein